MRNREAIEKRCKKKRSHLFHLVTFDASTSYAHGGTIEKLSCLGIKAGDEVVFLKTEDGYRIISAKDVIKRGIEIIMDVDVTVKETKEGLGKGFE
ncbi:MAG: hypothetical protein WBB08_04515 [Halobacteriota archaeon]